MALDLNAYWIDRGEHYRANDGPRLNSKFHRAQAQLFADTLAGLRCELGQIVEIGCGYGRVTRVVARALPGSFITGLDLSEGQVRAAAGYCNGVKNACFRQFDLYAEVLPKADCIYASEVMLHVPPARVAALVRMIMAAAPVFVHDFDPNVKPGTGNDPHCWAHDYFAIYDGLGFDYKAHIHGPHALMVVTR